MDRTIRKATNEDYQSVMEIQEDEILYGGDDYLPYEYYKLLIWHGAYVLEINKKIVGFLAYEIIDKSTCFIPQGGRISPSMRGQGHFKYLMEEVARRVQAECPTVKASRMSTSLSNSFKDRIMKSRRHVCSALYYHIPLSIQTDFKGTADSGNIFKVLTPEDLQKICDDETVVRNLSSNGYMLIDWRFYRFDHMEAQNRWKPFDSFHCIASYKKEGNIDEATALMLTSVSHRGPPNCSKFLRRLGLDLHSTMLTTELLDDHANYALKLLREKGVEFDEIRISVPENYEEVFASVFTNTAANGKSLCFQSEV